MPLPSLLSVGVKSLIMVDSFSSAFTTLPRLSALSMSTVARCRPLPMT